MSGHCPICGQAGCNGSCGSENLLTVVFRGLTADQKREIINRPDAVHLLHGNGLAERKELDRIASELQDTCHRQAQEIALLRSDPSGEYAHRLAIMLECALMSQTAGTWDEAYETLDQYRKAIQEWHEAQGEPYVSGFGKD